jgi:hypothetical protein
VIEFREQLAQVIRLVFCAIAGLCQEIRSLAVEQVGQFRQSRDRGNDDASFHAGYRLIADTELLSHVFLRQSIGLPIPGNGFAHGFRQLLFIDAWH